MIPTHVREQERELFEETLAKIAKAIAPEKIICFGSRTNCEQMWSNFLEKGNIHHYAYYDLLIITKAGDERREHEILDKISKYNKAPIHITAVVHSITAVNTAIQKGNRFFVTLYYKDTVLYDNNNIPQALPNANLDKQELAISADKEWSKSFGLGEKFYKVAVTCVTDELYDIAVFMHHQAAIIRYYTGYRPATHNLNRLLWLMENFTVEGTTVFPQVTKEETELFNVLLSAYSDVRYKQGYNVSGDAVLTLTERVNHLIEGIKQLHSKKKNSFEPAQKSTSDHELPPFESICLDTCADVVLQKGDREGDRIESKNDLIGAFKFTVEDKRLWVSMVGDKINWK